MSLLTQKDVKKYISILSSDGTLRTVVDKNTPGAVEREYETSDGKKGSKFELVFAKLEGKITNIAFWEGDYGKNLQIEVENAGEKAVLSVGVESSFGEDIMKKLPNIALDKEISFEPFAFENDKGKQVKGVSIKQGGEKIANYYWDADKKKPLNGLPKIDGKAENFDKDDWKVHFIKVRKFLTEEVQKLIEVKFPPKVPEPLEFPEDSMPVGEIPF